MPMLIRSIVCPSSMNSVSYQYLILTLLLATMIIRSAGCSTFASGNRADDAARNALRFQLSGATAMSKLIGLASELPGLLGICHHFIPFFFLAFPVLLRAIATACFWLRPALISVLIFWLMA